MKNLILVPFLLSTFFIHPIENNFFFTVSGKVIHGKHLGRTIGFPTANLAIPDDFILQNGVYAGYTITTDNKFQKVVMNIGLRPTVENTKKRLLEVYLIDYSGDLYGTNLTIKITNKIRDEKKFNSLKELKEQIIKDILQAKKLLTK